VHVDGSDEFQPKTRYNNKPTQVGSLFLYSDSSFADLNCLLTDLGEDMALFALLKSQAKKSCSLICCERKRLLLH
jgi:hypothetical protein